MRRRVKTVSSALVVALIALFEGARCDPASSFVSSRGASEGGGYHRHQQPHQPRQQQFFRSRPRDVDVAKGGTAVVECEVANRSGRVQWTKDGLTLGYDRSLPGFPRYTVLGHDTTGVFSLKITNATLTDDATYECQVGPAPGSKPIRASARIGVLLPPTKIELSGILSGTRLEVKENEEVELTCVVHDAKPKATVVWYRQNTEFYTESRADDNKLSDASGRTTSTSTIRFRPTAADNGVTWACEAEHQAIVYSPLRASVLLSVLHPPGPPEISGYIEGETIRLGQTVSLVCTAAGGNPLAKLTWHRNNELVDESHTTSGRESRNTYSFVATTEDDGARYRCQAKNDLSAQPSSADIVLAVQFAPDSLRLIGPSEARAGELLSYSCSTTNSNPAAAIHWTVGNETRPAERTNVVRSPSGGYITHSEITVSLGSTDRSKMIVCNAVNAELNDAKSESKMLSVIYPPGPPRILGISPGDQLVAGNLKRATCTSLAGNPLAKLEWFIGDRKLESRYFTKDNYASAELDFIPRPSDNGEEIRCLASNVALAAPMTERIRVGVNFPPSSVKIRLLPDVPKAGRNVTLVCETTSSNPPAKVTWWHNGERLTASAPAEEMEGRFFGTVTTSELVIEATARHHGAVVTCEAANEAADKRVHDAITLGVNHKPQFQPGNFPYELEEGRPATLNLTAEANPGVIKYTWTKETEEGRERDIGSDERVSVINGVAIFSEVRRDDAGIYRVTAENAEGAAQTKIEVKVFYPPRILDISPSVMVGQGEDALLECQVDASPLTRHTIRWERAGYDMAAKTKATTGLPSTSTGSDSEEDEGNSNVGVVLLTVLNVTSTDSGSFACVAENGVGDSVVMNQTYLLVRHKPTISTAPLLSKSAADLGETARIVCEASGVPAVNFTWARAGGPPVSASIQYEAAGGEWRSKYQLSQRVIDPLRSSAELLVFNVTNDDYGEFECVAHNSEGRSKRRISLDLKSRPDAPVDLRVSNVTHSAAYLTWTPGFHGGMEQYFRIKYNPLLDRGDVRHFDVYPADKNNARLPDLEPGTSYEMSIMSFNNLGESNYTDEAAVVTTSNRPPGDELMIREVLDGKGEIPLILIVGVSVCGTVLLLLNIVLVSCFVHKKKKKEEAEHGRKMAGGGGGGGGGGSDGSASTGSTKSSANMELYTHTASSSYNETMSGETLSSVSEKSCISNNVNGTHITPMSAAMAANGHIPYLDDSPRMNSHSTYLIDDPPLARSITLDQVNAGIYTLGPTPNVVVQASPYIHQHMPASQSMDITHVNFGVVCDNGDIYSAIRKNRLMPPPPPPLQHHHQHQQILEDNRDYEETESEYAVELRKQAYLQGMGDSGYGRNSVATVSLQPPPTGSSTSSSSAYSSLPPPPLPTSATPTYANHQAAILLQQQHHHHLHNGAPHTSSSPTAVVEGPICASSPKRAVSAFTTFGPRLNGGSASSGSSDSGSVSGGPNAGGVGSTSPRSPHRPVPTPTTGHLV